MKFPDNLRYTKDHEWTKQDGSAVIVGITAFAVDQLGDITLVELPDVGTTVTAGKSFGTVESVKSVSDLYAPTSGKVVRINDKLEDEPELINESPYDDGWMIAIEPTNNDADETSMSAAEYEKLTKREE